jgi:hypothetical protein
VEVAIIGKITGHFSSIVPPFPARGLSRPRRGGAWQCNWELPKHSVSTISLQGCGTHPGAPSAGVLIEEEEEDDDDDDDDDDTDPVTQNSR